MSVLPLADTVITIRTEVNDLGTDRSQTIRAEQPAGQMDAVNKRFTMARWPIVENSFQLWDKDGNLLATPAAYTIDLDTGILAMVAAPDFSAGARLSADYNHVWFPDESYWEFIVTAAGQIGVTTVTGVDAEERAENVLTSTVEGLVVALKLYAACQYYMSRGGEYTHQYNASAGGQSQSTESVSRNFRDSAKQMCERAGKARDDYFKGFGAREKPAAAIRNFSGVKRYQPRR